MDEAVHLGWDHKRFDVPSCTHLIGKAKTACQLCLYMNTFPGMPCLAVFLASFILLHQSLVALILRLDPDTGRRYSFAATSVTVVVGRTVFRCMHTALTQETTRC